VDDLVLVLDAVLVADFVTGFAAGLAAVFATALEAVLAEGLDADLDTGLRGEAAVLGVAGLTATTGLAKWLLGVVATTSGAGEVEEFIMHQNNQS
jgi:hypothetical protein